MDSSGGKTMEQVRSIERVRDRIGQAVLDFCSPGRIFHMKDLVAYIEFRCGYVAPDSPGRILRDLRKKRKLDYFVKSRRDSLYEIVLDHQMRLL